jgi:hypothetical protein
MSVLVTIRDELPQGKVLNEIRFEVGAERLTARELIRQRVHQEVSLYNLANPGSPLQGKVGPGLVQPSNFEARLNGVRPRQRRQIDWEVQADKALQAFESNVFFILVGDRQIEDLDESIELRADTQVTFLRLVPLVGG